MAEQVVSVALETVKDLLVEEGRFLVGVGGEVKALQTQLREIKCLLKDADRKRHGSEMVCNWIAEIRGLAYRAEDVIAEYAVEMDSDGWGRGLMRLLRRLSCLVTRCYSLHQLGSEILNIKTQLAKIINDMEKNGIKRSIIDGGLGESSAAAITDNPRKTFPNFQIGDCFVGKEDELKRLVSLVDDDKQHRVISVWGMGGIGKTTIARKLYNQMIEAKNDRFDYFSWFCITNKCRTRSVLEDILMQLQKTEDVSSLSHTQLVEQLCQIQRAKRCLIVLDDLWEISQWNGLKPAFLVHDLRSKILVTTRKKKVAQIGFLVELGLLNMDDGWELLKKKASPHTNNIPEFALQENLLHGIGKEMVRKCGYLPLAISLLGGVLSKKNSVRDWELVNENINASIYRGEGINDEKDREIDGVLNLSYEDLPYYLKTCFLYLGKLKEGESIYAVDLYRMWIAQGMISEENIRGKEETLTDIAERYLSELASRCIVQVEVEEGTDKYRTCKLHDVVRELCLSIGEKEEFGLQIFECQGGKISTSMKAALSRIGTRHLAIHFKRELQLEHDDLTITCEKDTTKHFRSLEIHSDINGKTVEFPPQRIVDFQNFKLLRGLAIVRFRFAGRKLPKGITNLVHLRYLRLRECELDEVPSSISNLAYLDTLDLRYSWNVVVPINISKMFRVKHLLLPSYDKETIGNYRLKLDEGFDELESLIGFDSSVHELKSISRIKNLRRFSGLIRDNRSLSAIFSHIATQWNKLSYCAVSIKQGCELTSKEGLQKLIQVFTCSDLYYLRIFVVLGKALEECRSHIISSKLVKLSMLDCEIENDPMGILGRLPCLTQLYLESRSFVGEEMTCPAFSFPCLKELKLDRLPKLREWRVEQGAMPLVSQIHIHCCPHLEKIPDGLDLVYTLQKLTISGMPKLGRRVSASGEDFHKLRHVPSITIHD